MIELFIVTWFAGGVAEHLSAEGAVDGLVLDEQVFRSFRLDALREAEACVSSQMSRYFHRSVSPPCPLHFCPDALQKKEYRDSPREPTLVMPRTNLLSDALFNLRCFLISFFLNLVARRSGSENARRKPGGGSVIGLSFERPRPGEYR